MLSLSFQEYKYPKESLFENELISKINNQFQFAKHFYSLNHLQSFALQKNVEEHYFNNQTSF